MTSQTLTRGGLFCTGHLHSALHSPIANRSRARTRSPLCHLLDVLCGALMCTGHGRSGRDQKEVWKDYVNHFYWKLKLAAEADGVKIPDNADFIRGSAMFSDPLSDV